MALRLLYLIAIRVFWDIKSRIAAFLREELKLQLPRSKTLVTHAASQAAHFLGYEIRARHSDTKSTLVGAGISQQLLATRGLGRRG